MELGIDSDGDGFQVEKLEELDPHSCATTSTTTAGHATPLPRSIQPLQPRPIPTNAAALAPRNPALGQESRDLDLAGSFLPLVVAFSGGTMEWERRLVVGGNGGIDAV
jgi:hypothetical protein